MLVFELSGPASTAAVLLAVIARLAAPDALQEWLTSASHEALLGAAWIAVEAVFYSVCMVVALRASLDRGPKPLSESLRGGDTLWRRILNDPSQTPTEFVESWHYSSRRTTPSPVALLLELSLIHI